MFNSLLHTIQRYRDRLTCELGGGCCHELFLYLGAHGDTNGFYLFDANGSGANERINYRELRDMLSGFAECVKIIVFIDACYSGAAIVWLGDLCSSRSYYCGATIVTATDATHEAAGGQGPTDSATQDFLEDAANQDRDGDQRTGDFGDRWMHMQSQGQDYGPQRFICPGQTSMCSTD